MAEREISAAAVVVSTLRVPEAESVPNPRGTRVIGGREGEGARGGVLRPQARGTSVRDIRSSTQWPRRRSVLQSHGPVPFGVRVRHDVDLVLAE